MLVFALAVPFWLLGRNMLPIPVELPVSALIFMNPAIAAASEAQVFALSLEHRA